MKKLLVGFTVLALTTIAQKAEAYSWDYAKKLSKNANVVLIDISEQKLSIINNSRVIFSANTITGKDGTATDVNTRYNPHFTIHTHTNTPRTLDGYDPVKKKYYSAPVTFWIAYNRGEGMHDATWRQPYQYQDKTLFRTKGSNGCSNLSYEDAKTVYRLTQKYGKVVVIP